MQLLGLDFAPMRMPEALAWAGGRPAGARFGYVVTPNADHLVRLHRDPDTYGPLYRDAVLRLLDSRVVARLAHAMGLPAPPVVTGSDLTEAVFRGLLTPEDPVAILGAPARAVERIVARYGLRTVFHHDPPMGFDNNPAAFEAALCFVEEHAARFVFLAVGSPRQEKVARALVQRGRATGLGLCIGASLLFLAGEERRAPRAVQRAGLEWAWRLSQDPRRLARRYLVDSPAILGLLLQERRARNG
jgi:exopolysaccharide biosynthesis WecB/TagA/CpsF family protein